MVVELGAEHAEAAAALWAEAGLVRPWNDPQGDFLRAVSGRTSAVLGVIGMLDDAGAGTAEPVPALRGTAMVGADGHRGWVYYVAVRPQDRGQGLGALLMAAAEDWLRQAGAPKVQLMVRTTNAAVVGFYERLGYADQHTSVLGKFLDPELEALRRSHG
ncbi:GNAT family acetyltransferase [Galactobacter caseinivorans]|uniref:GNAT family acetyltransferase n=2 Tax=Galactobacter caseinivorans TaxID=2676123 RepID=A0A496PJ90_9MICC|nr:GNAT family acetyltransferase [Galactobacter caseinivorans]